MNILCFDGKVSPMDRKLFYIKKKECSESNLEWNNIFKLNNKIINNLINIFFSP